MSNLTAIQKAWWARLDQLVREQNVQDQHGLQAVMRQLALEVITAQPEQNKIKLGDQTLRVFGKNQRFKTKAEFIAHHRQNGVWAEDDILFPLANALGYTTFIHQFPLTDLRPYEAYDQPNRTGLKLDIVNYTMESENYAGYVEGGHYELKGRTNPGGGNCMYYSVAQRVERDMLFVSQELKEEFSLIGLASYQINAQASQMNRADRYVNQNRPDLTEAEQAYFDERDRIEAAKEQEVRELLTNCSTQKLIAIYRDALNKNLVGNDTYLKNRPDHSTKEYKNNDFMRQALTTGQWNKDFQFLIREELIHALAKEAWRNPRAYEAFTKSDFIQQSENLNQFGFLGYKSCAAEAKEESVAVLSTIPTCT